MCAILIQLVWDCTYGFRSVIASGANSRVGVDFSLWFASLEKRIIRLTIKYMKG